MNIKRGLELELPDQKNKQRSFPETPLLSNDRSKDLLSQGGKFFIPGRQLALVAAILGGSAYLNLTEASSPNPDIQGTPTPTPSSHLFLPEGAPSQRAYTQLVRPTGTLRQTEAFQINDIKVAGGRAIVLASLPDPNPGSYAGSDWHVAVGDLDPANPSRPLVLREAGPFTDYIRTVAVSDGNHNIMFAGGSTAPYSHPGIGYYTTDGWATWQRLQVSESISNGYITPDNKSLIMVEGDEAFPSLPVYSKLDLVSGSRTLMNNTCGIYTVPITTLKRTADNTYTGYGWSETSGYERITFNSDNTVSCQWLDKEGSAPDSFFRYTGTGNTDMLGLVRYVMDPSGNSTLGRINLYANEILSGTMTVSKTLYPEYSDTSIDAIGGAVDTTSNILYMTTMAYPLYSMGLVLNVDYSPLTALGDIAQRKRIPQDGTWFTPGRAGGSRSVQTTNILTSGNERYLGVVGYFVNTDQAKSGLKLKRITNGANSTDIWQSAILQLAETTPTTTATSTATSTSTAIARVTATSTSTATVSPTVEATSAIVNPTTGNWYTVTLSSNLDGVIIPGEAAGTSALKAEVQQVSIPNNLPTTLAPLGAMKISFTRSLDNLAVSELTSNATVQFGYGDYSLPESDFGRLMIYNSTRGEYLTPTLDRTRKVASVKTSRFSIFVLARAIAPIPRNFMPFVSRLFSAGW